MIPIQTHHLESLGWTLIHFCWQAAAIAIAYKVVDLAISRGSRKATSQTRYVFALAAMLCMFATATGTLLYEELRLQRTAVASYATESVTNSTDPAPSDAAAVLSAEVPTTQPSLRESITAALPRPEAFLPWLDALWMFGVLALSARTVGGWIIVQRLRSTATQQIPPALAASFTRLSRRIGVHGRVALRLSTRIASPLAIGMMRSLILLPASALTMLSADQLEAVLAHELAHIRRADYLWNILQTMIETLFFFHPAVWWVGSSLRQQRELCCDDIAIASCVDPLTYATALLLLEEERAREIALHTATTKFPLALALDGHQSRVGLRSRIARILGEPMEPTSSSRNIAPFSIVGVCGALALFLLPLPQVFASLHPAPQQATLAPLAPVAAEPAIPELSPTPAAADAVVAQPSHAARFISPTPAPDAIVATPAQPATPALAPTPNPLPTPAAAPQPRIAPLASPQPRLAPMPPAQPRTAPRAAIILPEHWSPAQFAITFAHLAFPGQAPAPPATGTSTPPADSTIPHSDYIDQMRAAGYDGDIDHFIALKTAGVTPEFAKSMGQIGFGKPTDHQLIQLKIFGVTPEYVAQLKSSGMKADNFQDLISYRMFKVTPEYIASMKAAGFGDIPSNKLIQLRIQNVTPELAKAAKEQFPDITVDQLVQLQIFHINGPFIAEAKRLGLTPLTVDKLVRLRISGLIEDDYSKDKSKDKDKDKDKSLSKK
jgi:beta-lactamase regulating signal transducer with metallopeptidase domain